MSAFLNYDYILMTIVGQDENVSKILSISSKFVRIYNLIRIHLLIWRGKNPENQFLNNFVDNLRSQHVIVITSFHIYVDKLRSHNVIVIFSFLIYMYIY